VIAATAGVSRSRFFSISVTFGIGTFRNIFKRCYFRADAAFVRLADAMPNHRIDDNPPAASRGLRAATPKIAARAIHAAPIDPLRHTASKPSRVTPTGMCNWLPYSEVQRFATRCKKWMAGASAGTIKTPLPMTICGSKSGVINPEEVPAMG
jgi:hypothetical protein